MNCSNDKARLIRNEFACFLHIGSSAEARVGAEEMIARYRESAETGPVPTFRIEICDGEGIVREILHFEPDEAQLLRLENFLSRFTAEEVRQMESLLDR